MPSEQFTNSGITTLSAAINNSQTTIDVTSATLFPALPNFRIRIGDELLLVTAVSGTNWTVQRGIEGTTALSKASGTQVALVLTANVLNALSALEYTLSNLGIDVLLGHDNSFGGPVQQISLGTNLSMSGTTLNANFTPSPPTYNPGVLLGRENSSSGPLQEITLGSNLSMTATTLDVTVSNSGRLLGRGTSSGTVDEISLGINLNMTGNTLSAIFPTPVPISNGGTNATSFTSGKLTYFNGTSIVSTAVIDYVNTGTNIDHTTISSSDYTNIPLVVKGASSQSSNLTQWRNSSTTVLSSIDAFGRYITGSAYSASLSLSSTGGGSGVAGTFSGDDQAGMVQITTGTSCATNSAILTLNFAHSFANTPKTVIIAPANANAQALIASGAFPFVDYSSLSTSGFTLQSTSVALTDSTTYQFWYKVNG